ncbi:MAG: RDD family protein [Bacilli bacterium]|nr:RDD family protein [Bacilli bacterium]
MDKTNGEIVEIVRESPTFFRLFSAHLFDFFLTAILTALLLFAFSNAYMALPSAVEARQFREGVQVESGLFLKSEGTIKNVGDYYPSLGLTHNEVSDKLDPILNAFFLSYLHEELGDGEEVYLSRKAQAKLSSGESLFDKNGNRIFANPDYDENYSSFYISACKDFAPGYLGYKQGYLEARRTLILLEAAAFETSLLVSYLVFYVLPPLFFHRGKQTLGKKLSGIYLLGSDGFSPSIRRQLVFNLFHYVFFFLLGPITFMAPYFISLTMMATRKQRQTLSEYVFALFPIAGKKEEVYESEEELLSKK